MDLGLLHHILSETTVQLRKGPQVETRKAGPVEVVEVFAMPHVDEAPDLEKIDLVFVMIGVDRAKAEHYKPQLVALLNEYPDKRELSGGPSYIHVGATIGDQGAALQLFALGKALGLWDIITPALLGFTGDEMLEKAGMGMIWITGFRNG